MGLTDGFWYLYLYELDGMDGVAEILADDLACACGGYQMRGYGE
jgi:hypothetical protein